MTSNKINLVMSMPKQHSTIIMTIKFEDINQDSLTYNLILNYFIPTRKCKVYTKFIFNPKERNLTQTNLKILRT